MADLDARGDLRLKAEYQYDVLERVAGAPELIGRLSGLIWRSPDAFNEELPTDADTNVDTVSASEPLSVRWRASSPSAGIATLRAGDGRLLSVTILACGLSAEQDAMTLRAFQSRLLHELHDSGFEPSFDLLALAERPLAATINVASPTDPAGQRVAALADRCFAAAYFRYHGLA